MTTPREEPLHLLKIPIRSDKLYAFARRARQRVRDFDEGYAVHALFAALFDHGADAPDRIAPKPFALPEPSAELAHPSASRCIEVLAYSSRDHAALLDRARTFSDPAAWSALEVDRIVSRPMPTTFQGGARLGFSVRVCPVRRVAKRGNQVKERAEVDAFLAKVWQVSDDTVQLDRETVYREWLSEELAKGGARLREASMTSFHLGRQHRRTQASSDARREGRLVHHPSATFSGVLEVTEPSLFPALLARGLGRHRAFGFGMLLLRPAR
jgi:CRISPR system Cascade subunit CasE